MENFFVDVGFLSFNSVFHTENSFLSLRMSHSVE